MEALKSYEAIEVSGYSLQGSRDNQQDYWLIRQLQDRTIAIVCDGMGGMTAGETASQFAANRLLEDLLVLSKEENIYDFFRRELEKLDDAVYALKGENGKRLGAGTTIAAVMIFGNELYWFSVGDTKIYYKRNGEMHCLTREHNYAMHLSELREKNVIDNETYLNELSKGEQLISFLGLGTAEIYDSNYNALSMRQGDCIFICTDGVYRTLTNDEILDVLRQHGSCERMNKMMENAMLSKRKSNQDNATWVTIRRR